MLTKEETWKKKVVTLGESDEEAQMARRKERVRQE